jgi:hypothetical protein
VNKFHKKDIGRNGSQNFTCDFDVPRSFSLSSTFPRQPIKENGEENKHRMNKQLHKKDITRNSGPYLQCTKALSGDFDPSFIFLVFLHAPSQLAHAFLCDVSAPGHVRVVRDLTLAQHSTQLAEKSRVVGSCCYCMVNNHLEIKFNPKKKKKKLENLEKPKLNKIRST